MAGSPDVRSPSQQRREAPVLDQQVARMEVAVNPQRRPAPLVGSERAFPQLEHGVTIDLAPESSDVPTQEFGSHGESDASPWIAGSVRGCRAMQSLEKRAERVRN